MKRFKRSGRLAIFALSAAMLSGHALAIPMTVAGSTVSFTFDDSLTGLFGTPTAVGDSLSFFPTNFKAESFNGAGLVSTSSTVNVSVSANPGYFVSGVNLREDGDYYNIGASSQVAVGGKLYIRNGGNPLDPAASQSISSTQPLTDMTTLAGFDTTNWNATAGVTVPASWGGVSGVTVTLQDILLASSTSPGSGAFIEKKFAALSVVTSPVPEPQSYALFLAGVGLVGWVARRRTRFTR